MTDDQLTAAQALAIAEADAVAEGYDLTMYRVVVVLDRHGWRVDYWLNLPRHAGGGPHYVIHPPDRRVRE